MIDFDEELSNIKQINIPVEDFNKNNIPKNIRNSVALYNKAIVSLKSNNFSPAIADLKKSLSRNPSFCEAVKLLGLCYAYTNQFSKAEKYFKKLAKYSMYRATAEDCLKELNNRKINSRALDAIRSHNSKASSKGNGKFSGLRQFVFLLALVIITAGVILFYRVHVTNKPTLSALKNSDAIKEKAASQSSTAEDKAPMPTVTYSNVEDSVKGTSPDKSTSSKDNLNNSSQLNDAEKLYNDGNYEKAIDMLIALKDATFDTASKEKFDTLLNNIKSNEIWTIYKQANGLYKQKKYADALPKLIKVEAIDPDPKLMPWILYQMGMCYKEASDSKNALLYFQKVKTDYPKSTYASYCDRAIELMSQ